MADNVDITPGDGATVAADDIGGVLYQRVKISHGADGSATDASAASPLPVTAATLPLPSGAATSAKQDTLAGLVATAANQATEITALGSLLTELQAKADLTETQPVSAASLPLPSGAATSANQTTIIGHVDGIETLLTTIDGHVDGIEGLQTAEATLIGAVTETAPATDTASSGLNGRLQRIAQRVTSLIALIPAALTGSGNFKVAVQEALPAGTATIGAAQDAGSSRTHTRTVVTSADASAGADLSPAPTSGQKIVLDDLFICVAVEMDIEIKEETSGTLVMPKIYSAVPGLPYQLTPRANWKLPTADKKLRIQTSVAGNVSAVSATHSEA